MTMVEGVILQEMCYGPHLTRHFYGNCVLHVVGSVILTEVVVCT